jgi:hypothetical protein
MHQHLMHINLQLLYLLSGFFPLLIYSDPLYLFWRILG